MTWTAPPVDRIDPPLVNGERDSLEAWLEYHRATLLSKCAGLTGEQLVQRAAAPSALTLLGLVRHMADVERAWFCRRVAGDPDLPHLYFTEECPDADFDLVDAGAAEADFATFTAECDRARQVSAGKSLDDTFLGRTGNVFDVRWAYVHMIEEYARHNGHADLLREHIDGVTGS